MSTYSRLTKNPKTGKFEKAEWRDDYYERHHYGVIFPDGMVVDPWEVELETKDADDTVSHSKQKIQGAEKKAMDDKFKEGMKDVLKLARGLHEK